MSKAIEVVFFREDDQWVARALNVEVSSFGDSLEDARSAIREALELYFDDAHGIEVPEASEIHVEKLLV